MCGIVAISSINEPLPFDILDEPLHRLRYRGPDSFGTWSSGDQRCHLGHCRLSILDLSENGKQPMPNEDKTIWLTYNGEIYNYKSLRSRLEGLGHQFYSTSDSEVIIHAYEEWAENCLDELIGMFAFVIWDENQKKLFAARDHVGIKPLSYATWNDGIAIASTLDALKTICPYTAEINPLALAYALSNHTVPAPLSIWNNMFKLEAGHYLTWTRKNGLSIHKWWAPPMEVGIFDDYSFARWEELFSCVLQDHLQADVPMGIFLSAGQDSSCIAAGVRDIRHSLQAYSVDIPSYHGNESPIARKTAQKLGYPFESVKLDTKTACSIFPATLIAYDEPECDANGPLPIYLISQSAAKSCKVVLSGDGGDECFGGYSWHQKNDNAQHNSDSMTGFMKALLSRCISKPRTIDQASQASDLLCSDHIFRYKNPINSEAIETLLSPTRISFNNKTIAAPLKKHDAPQLPSLRRRQRIDLMNFCSDWVLFKVDRASMGNSLEVRVPFLDKRIIEWAISRPVNNNEGVKDKQKPILRKYIQKNKLNYLLKQKKSGFSSKNVCPKPDSMHHLLRDISKSTLYQKGILNDEAFTLVMPQRCRLTLLKNVWYLCKWHEIHGNACSTQKWRKSA